MPVLRIAIALLCLACLSCRNADIASGPSAQATEPQWIPMFDGQSLGRWASTPFGGEGEVRIENSAIVLPMGSSMTGVTWQGEPPARINYEIELEAMRTLGNDFFCGLTFPVKDDPCSLIVGGWGGVVVGLSSLDGLDASSNDTTKYMTFEDDRWYRIRLHVTENTIVAWIDGEKVVNANITGRKVSVRPEVFKSKPLGISTWNTEGRIRGIRWRAVD